MVDSKSLEICLYCALWITRLIAQKGHTDRKKNMSICKKLPVHRAGIGRNQGRPNHNKP